MSGETRPENSNISWSVRVREGKSGYEEGNEGVSSSSLAEAISSIQDQELKEQLRELRQDAIRVAKEMPKTTGR